MLNASNATKMSFVALQQRSGCQLVNPLFSIFGIIRIYYLSFIETNMSHDINVQCSEQQSPSDFALAKEIKISCKIIPMCFASVTQRGKYETILSLMNKDHMIREA